MNKWNYENFTKLIAGKPPKQETKWYLNNIQNIKDKKFHSVKEG